MPAVVSPRKLLKLADLMARAYARIGAAARAELLPAADNYDLWFTRDAVPQIERNIAVDVGGRWTEKAGPNAIPAAGRIVEEGCSKYIIQPVVDWTLEHFIEFWQEGYGLWRLNREMMLLPTPRRVVMTPAEGDAVAGYQRAEISAWQDHLARHRRHVERFVHAACVQGWTRDLFVRNMTAPDGHTVGFRYGNADLSWHEHIRRYVVGRPHMMAAAAVEWRMKNSPGARRV